MSDSSKKYRSLDDWYKIVTECRQSGLTDEQWCLTNGIKKYALYSAIKRLRQKAYSIPSPWQRTHDVIHDLTASRQDVVKVDIVPDIQPPQELIPEMATHLDNSHMIEISLGDVQISLCNGADPDLVVSTISALRSFV